MTRWWRSPDAANLVGRQPGLLNHVALAAKASLTRFSLLSWWRQARTAVGRADASLRWGRRVSDWQPSSNKRTRQRRRSTGDQLLGDRIRRFRTRLNLSQEAAAQRIGRSEGWLLQVENGRADPGYSDLLLLAPVLTPIFAARKSTPIQGPESGPQGYPMGSRRSGVGPDLGPGCGRVKNSRCPARKSRSRDATVLTL